MAQSLSTSGARSRQKTAMVRWWAAGADIPGCAMRGKKVRQIVDFCYSSDSATRATANVTQSYFGEMALRDSILEKPLR
jgi:hypothetical protein